MAVNDKGAWIGFGVGDTDPVNAKPGDANYQAVTLINAKLGARYRKTTSVIPDFNAASSSYTVATATAVATVAANMGLTIPHDTDGRAVANLAFRTKIGAYPPPPPPVHVAFTVRGTGGIIGADYTSQLAQALPNLYREHPINYYAAMGGIPVAAAVNPSDPSGNECAQQACQMLADAVLGSSVTFSIFGYSLGCQGVVLFLNRLFNPSDVLYAQRDRLVAVVLIADPWRPFGKSFYNGPVPSGQGIGAPYFTMSQQAQDELGWRCCWLSNPADMYTNSPLGATGQVLADVEQIILGTAVSDPMATIGNAIPYILKLIQTDGGLAPMLTGQMGSQGILDIFSAVASGSMVLTAGLVAILGPILESALSGLMAGIGSNGTIMVPGIAADVQAAILALKFFGSGIAPHCQYHTAAWGIGPQTYLQLGIQHAADWANRVQVRL